MDDQRDEDCYIVTKSEFEHNINKTNGGIRRATHQAIIQISHKHDLESVAKLPPELRAIIFQYALAVSYTLDERHLTHIVTSEKRSLLYPRCLPTLLQTSYEFRSTLFHDFLKVNEVHMDDLGKLREAIDDYEEEEGLHNSDGGTIHVRHAVVGDLPPGPTEEQFVHQMELLLKCKEVRTVTIMNYSGSKTAYDSTVEKLTVLRHLRKVTMVQDALTIGKAGATAFEQRVIRLGFNGFVKLPETVLGHQDMYIDVEVGLTFEDRAACFLQRLKQGTDPTGHVCALFGRRSSILSTTNHGLNSVKNIRRGRTDLLDQCPRKVECSALVFRGSRLYM